jgi:transcriptional regulator with XRE-family HTH domain
MSPNDDNRSATNAPHRMDAQGEPSDTAIARAIGEELRNARTAVGWSRLQLVSRLPSGIGDRTLLSYEHGTRHLTVLRLIELCHALEVAAPTLLNQAMQRAQIHLQNLALDDAPTTPKPATLAAVADHITEIITSGTHNQTKALVEALVAKVTITAPDRLIPVFRIPQPRNNDGTATALPAGTTPTGMVRTMTKSVGRVGLEPTAKGL